MNEGVKNKVRDSIHFDFERKNNEGLNCYAYAIGIDLKEKDVCSYAFNPGQMGTYITYSDDYDLYKTMCTLLYSKSFEERFMFDMKALDIDVDYASESEDSEYIDDEGYFNWLVAMYKLKPRFLQLSDLHFLRKTASGIWVHKLGHDGNPSNLDENGNIITTLPEQLAYSKKRVYNNPSVYKLRMKR